MSGLYCMWCQFKQNWTRLNWMNIIHSWHYFFICIMHSDILDSWKFSFCDHVSCQSSFICHVSMLGIHVSMYDWLPSGLPLLWRWHGLSDELSTHQAAAVRPPRWSQQPPGPKTAAGGTPASPEPPHYTPNPFSNTVTDRPIIEYKIQKREVALLWLAIRLENTDLINSFIAVLH